MCLFRVRTTKVMSRKILWNISRGLINRPFDFYVLYASFFVSLEVYKNEIITMCT